MLGGLNPSATVTAGTSFGGIEFGGYFPAYSFILGDNHLGDAVESELKDIAKSVGAEGKIFYQDVAEGTGHAILCARECLKGDVIVAFADTLFKTEFNLDKTKDGVMDIWQSMR